MIDSNKIDLGQEIEKIQRNDPGQIRGFSIKFLANFLIRKEGPKALDRVKEELNKYNYKLPDIKEIDDMEWMPSGVSTIFIVACVKIFNWHRKDILETGQKMIPASIILKLYIKHFTSLERTFRMATRAWKKNYTFGELELVRYDSEKKEVVIRLKNNKRHPFMCIHFEAVFSGVVKLATGSDKVAAKEIKCEFKGDSYHEYLLTW